MPTRPATTDAVGQERRRPPVVTRLVTLALMAAAATVVVTATAQSKGGVPRAKVAASTTPSVVVPNGQPTLVQIVNGQHKGDAILLRVNPVAAGATRNLVVSPGARVSGETLQALLAAAADRQSPMHRVRYALTYDATGAIVAITPR